ncbi:MAG: hypothetical protein IJ242_14550 [Clostridia bacterium]|nr:hypothetical protein [Clostridia bacterium]
MAKHFVLVCQTMASAIDTMPKTQLYHYKEMAQHLVLVCQIMTTAIDTVPKARLCH